MNSTIRYFLSYCQRYGRVYEAVKNKDILPNLNFRLKITAQSGPNSISNQTTRYSLFLISE